MHNCRVCVEQPLKFANAILERAERAAEFTHLIAQLVERVFELRSDDIGIVRHWSLSS